jgi:Flp pilus assembly protein TadG
MVFLGEFTLDQAATRVARMVRTGEAQKAGLSADDFHKAICTEVSYLLKCTDLAVDLKVYGSFAELPPPSAVQNGTLNTTGFGYQLGGSQAVQALRIYYKWPVITDMMRSTMSDMSDGSHLLSSIVVFQTEPY